jgi:hypothetical protein
MSGGRFDYLQYRITEITDAIEHEILTNNDEPNNEDWFYANNFKDETIAEFKKGVQLLKEAQVYAQRIDWLLSGDDGEDTFHLRLADDLSKLK